MNKATARLVFNKSRYNSEVLARRFDLGQMRVSSLPVTLLRTTHTFQVATPAEVTGGGVNVTTVTHVHLVHARY